MNIFFQQASHDRGQCQSCRAVQCKVQTDSALSAPRLTLRGALSGVSDFCFCTEYLYCHRVSWSDCIVPYIATGVLFRESWRDQVQRSMSPSIISVCCTFCLKNNLVVLFVAASLIIWQRYVESEIALQKENMSNKKICPK